MVVYNAVKRGRTKKDDGPVKIRHNVSEETPLPLYLAMKVRAEMRNRDLIEHMFRLRLCVSYDRFLQVSASCHKSLLNVQATKHEDKILLPNLSDQHH